MKKKNILKMRRGLKNISYLLRDSNLPGLEAEMLLSHSLGLPRPHLFAHPEQKVNFEFEQTFLDLVKRRHIGEPIAYLIGSKEFYGMRLKVDHRALIPRDETEGLVLEALKLEPKSVADIGTGSGAIALALAKHLPKSKIYASDVSAEAISLALENAKDLGLEKRVTFLVGSLLDPIPGPVDLITANLPYVRNWMIKELPVEIKEHEPLIALDGGDDGLFWYNQLFSVAKEKLNPGGEILYELDGRIYVWTPPK